MFMHKMGIGSERILDGLNPAQLEAVQATEGPLLILAGAGSGKTSVLTRRIAYLLGHCRVSPWNVLAITFTNKAAREMRERIEQWVGLAGQDVMASTFHSFCAKILRRDIDQMGYSTRFTVLDSSDQIAIVRKILRDYQIDSKRFDPRAVLGGISQHKNALVSPQKAKDGARDLFSRIVADTYIEYERRLKLNEALDFDDLIMKTVELFRAVPEVRSAYSQKYRYIHVDEYQDTNHAQYILIRLLADEHRNLCAVGDSDQSIYGWRGADIRNILQFEKDFPEAKVIRLEQNYRSTQTILDIANHVIRNNRDRQEKTLWTDGEKGEAAQLLECRDERVEAAWISQELVKWVEAGGQYTDAAVLYRTNAQSRVIEETFLQRGIPYRIYGGVRFYERKEIRDLIAYLRLIDNPADDASFLRIVNVPKRGIGDTSLGRLAEYANAHQMPLLAACEHLEAAGLSGKAKMGLTSFAEWMEECHEQQKKLSVTEITRLIIEQTKYVEMLQTEHSLEAESRIENLEEFLSLTKEFDENWPGLEPVERLSQFLTDVSLVADTDMDNGRPSPESAQGVTLMTLHSAKGLEFPIVFLIGMEEGIFPHSRSFNSEEELEEERRLCYVGVTRARKRLYLSTCATRMIFGDVHSYTPSRFLKEMPVHCLQRISPGQPSEKRELWRPRSSGLLQQIPSSFGADLSVEYHVGDRVLHRKWGQGVILSTSGSGEDMEMTVHFPAPIGERKLAARFAPIRKSE